MYARAVVLVSRAFFAVILACSRRLSAFCLHKFWDWRAISLQGVQIGGLL